jgi:hypothetical protein
VMLLALTWHDLMALIGIISCAQVASPSCPCKQSAPRPPSCSFSTCAREFMALALACHAAGRCCRHRRRAIWDAPFKHRGAQEVIRQWPKYAGRTASLPPLLLPGMRGKERGDRQSRCGCQIIHDMRLSAESRGGLAPRLEDSAPRHLACRSLGLTSSNAPL